MQLLRFVVKIDKTDFRAHCESMNAARTLSAPDFGKIIKCVFPRVKARRLGTRGNSKYPFILV